MPSSNPQPLAIPLTASELLKDRETRTKHREVICRTHDKIQDAAERIQTYDLVNARISDIATMHEEILELSEYIVELVEYAKERGQAMENRLYEYSNAIEELGFKRRK